MAWDTTAFGAGSIPTAADFLSRITNNFKELGDPWTAYTPSWSSSGTAPAIGNGTLTGGFIEANKLIHFWVSMTAGSTTTYGTGNWTITLPVADVGQRFSFSGIARDTSASASYPIAGERISSATLQLRAWPTSAAGAVFTNLSSTVPFTWATGDSFTLNGTYEAA
jgi:hypothetical protein